LEDGDLFGYLDNEFCNHAIETSMFECPTPEDVVDLLSRA
jgi:hypothetical protein